MNVLSLFDGISCGRVALERAGIKVDNYFSSEIDQKAIAISERNYSDIIRLADINNNESWELPKIDLVIGGSPCQGFSRNGKMLNFDDPRSKLFFEFVKVKDRIKENNPNALFMLENVEMKKEWSAVITQYVKEEQRLINSNVLSAQNRPRLYWTDIQIAEIIDKEVVLLDILQDVNTENYIKQNGIWFDPGIDEKARALVSVENGEVRVRQATKKGYIVAENGDGVNLQFPTSKTRRGRVIKQKSPTLDCQCEVCVYYDGMIRKLTIRELERLQTLPEGYTDGATEKDAKKAIGNGWTAEVITHIFRGIKEVQ